jgi:hypothetical protein
VPDAGSGTGFISVMAQVHANESSSAVGLFDVTGGGNDFVSGQDTVCPDRVTPLPPGTLPGDLFITPDNEGLGVEADYGTPEVANQGVGERRVRCRRAVARHARGDGRNPYVRARVRGLRLRRHPDGVQPQAVDHAPSDPVARAAYNPSCLPRISFMTSSVPPPMGPRRASRTARSMPYSRTYP